MLPVQWEWTVVVVNQLCKELRLWFYRFRSFNELWPADWLFRQERTPTFQSHSFGKSGEKMKSSVANKKVQGNSDTITHGRQTDRHADVKTSSVTIYPTCDVRGGKTASVHLSVHGDGNTGSLSLAQTPLASESVMSFVCSSIINQCRKHTIVN